MYKKALSLILSVALTMSILCTFANAQSEEITETIETTGDEVVTTSDETVEVLGDINNDGALDIIDVALIRGYIVGNITLNEDELLRADFNKDGNGDIIDVALMRNEIVNQVKNPDSETDKETDTDNIQVITRTYEIWVVQSDTVLRIRDNPSLNANQVGSLSGNEALKIYETVTADGFTWGKIYTVNDYKTYDGNWCALDYATMVGTVTETEIINNEPQDQTDPEKIIDTLPAMIGEAQNAKLIRIKEDYTSIYNANHRSSFYAPVYSQLPQGTLEYYSKSDGTYYYSTDGRKYKIEKNQVDIISSLGFGYNNLYVKSIADDDGSTVLTIKTDDKTAFNIQPYSVTYPHINDDDYFYTIESFNPTEVRIVFDNITGIAALPSFSGNDLFSGYYWTKVEDCGRTKFCLALTLKQSGIYNGARSNYDENGNLVIRFTRYPKSISGARIVVDPGHGVEDSGAIGYLNGAAYYEKDINWAIANKLATKLRALGAEVFVLPSDQTNIDHTQRAHYARQYNPDIYISVHCNSVASGYSTARGTQTYYYTPMSYPLAQSIVKNVESVIGYSNVSSNCLEGEYSVVLQNDFSSILLETAFMSNPSDLQILLDTTKQDEIASAIVKGISEFFVRKN